MDILTEQTDLISVIVPFLNGAGWLIEALQSVIEQTYTNWEIVVIDDGSHSYHSRIAKEFCSRYPGKILYTEHENHQNKGVSESRNEAARLARGTYLAFLDADDKWLPRKLEEQLRCLKKYPRAAMACEGIIKWYSWNNGNEPDYVQPVGVDGNTFYQPGELTTLLYPFTDAAPPAPSGVMIKSKVFETHGGFEAAYHGIYELYEDQAFLAKLYLSETIYVSGSANVMYRKRGDSMCSAANDIQRYHTVRAFFFDWFQNYMELHRIRNNQIDYLLDKARIGLTHANVLQPV